MTTYYVSPTGNNSNDGLGPGDDHAWLTIGKATSIVSANDTVKILYGTYSESITEGNTGPIVYEAYDSLNQPILDGLNIYNQAFRINGSQITLKNVKITNYLLRGVYFYGSNNIVELCNIYDNVRSIFSYSTGSGNIVRRSILTGSSNSLYNLWLGGDIDVYYCQITGENQNSTQIGMTLAGTVNVYNNLIARGKGLAVANAGPAIVTVKNNLILPNGYNSTDPVLKNTGSGSLSYGNNLIAFQPYQSESSGCVDLGGNIVNQEPEITNYNGQGYIILRHDDFLDEVESFATIAESYGLKLSFACNKKANENKSNLSNRLNALVSAGHAVGNHGDSHIGLANTTAFVVQYDGAESNPTIDIDQVANTITLATTEGGDDVLISNTDTKRQSDVASELSGENWSISDGYEDVNLTSLADTAGPIALTGSPPTHTTNLDQAAFFYDELDAPKAWIEGVIGGGFVSKHMTYPGGSQNETVRDAVKTAGFEIAGSSEAFTGHDMSNLDIFQIQLTGDGAWQGDLTEATIRANIRGLLMWCAENNLVTSLLFHYASAAALERYDWVCDEISNFSAITNITYDELETLVKDSGNWADADGDGERWTRTFTDQGDYHPNNDAAPLVDAGLDLGLTEDYEGNSVPVGDFPEIGIYEHTPTTTTSTTTTSSTTTSTSSTTTTTVWPGYYETIDLESEITLVVDIDSGITKTVVDIDSEITEMVDLDSRIFIAE